MSQNGLRIAVFHNLPSGGAKRSLSEWIRRLSTTHKVDVYTMSTANHEYCDIRPFVNKHRVFDFTPHKLFESPFGRLNQLQRWLDLEDLERVGRNIAFEINAAGYDVLFVHPCLFTNIPSFIHHVQIPSLYYLHEPFGKGYKLQIRHPYRKNEGKWGGLLDRVDPLIYLHESHLENIRKNNIRHTTRFLANSHFTSQVIKASYNVDAPVCYCGVDIQTFRPIPEMQNENNVISVGELTPRKGFDFLINSLALIPADKRPALKLVCNHEDALERSHIQALADQSGVKVSIINNLSSNELTVAYNKARLCVYAPVCEPFGLAPLEAMASGVAVVAVREAGVEETVVHEFTGLLTDRDPRQFANAVETLLDDPSLAKTYGQNGREKVTRRWTWERSTQDMEKYLFECASLQAKR